MLFIVITIVTALSLMNLLATALILRILKQGPLPYPKSLTRPPPHLAGLIGRPSPEFEAATTDGEILSGKDFQALPALVGFFSTGCAPCHERAPEFANLSRETAGAFAIITGAGADRDDLITLLQGSSKVLVEPEAGKVARAFGIVAFPTLLTINDGRISGAGLSTQQIGAGARM